MHQDAKRTIYVKDKIILEIIKSNYMQAYEKEYLGLSSYKRIIKKDQQYLLGKRKTSYDKPSAYRWEIFVLKE